MDLHGNHVLILKGCDTAMSSMNDLCLTCDVYVCGGAEEGWGCYLVHVSDMVSGVKGNAIQDQWHGYVVLLGSSHGSGVRRVSQGGG